MPVEHVERQLDLKSAFVPADRKLRPPRLRSGLVARARLIERLQAAGDVVVITAPAGYGKTTLVSQWTAVDERPCAWVSLEAADNDPVLLLTNVSLALDRIEPVNPAVVPARSGPSGSMVPSMLPRFARMIAERERPVLLVLDDVHLVKGHHALDVLAVLVADLPPGSRLVLVGRTRPGLRFGRVRACRDMLELDARDLAFDLTEAAELFDAAAVRLDATEVEALVQRTEGWAAALHIAAMAIRSGEDGTGVSAIEFAGDQATMAEYLRDELLDELDDDTTTFLLQASGLDRLTGPLCDEVLQREGSGALLEQLERDHLVIPLDDRHRSYRLHPLLTDLLRADLAGRHPTVALTIGRSASRWYEADGDIDAAMTHAWQAGDTERVRTLVVAHFGSYASNGLLATAERWLQSFGRDELLVHPLLAALAAQARFGAGDGDGALSWLACAERLVVDRFPAPPPGRQRPTALTPAAGLALTRSLIAPITAAEIVDSARYALQRSPRGAYRAHAAVVLGVGQFMLGEERAAEEAFEDAVIEGQRAPTAQSIALASLAALHVERDAWEPAITLARRARALLTTHDIETRPVVVMVTAMSSLVEARAGNRDDAEAERVLTRRNLVGYTHVAPGYNLQIRVALVRAALLLGDRAGARTYLAEADAFLHVVPDAVRVKEQLAELHRALAGNKVARSHGPSSLTMAELRVLSHLPTHLSLAEIADRLFVTRNTVKSQSISIYRKLGVSSRGPRSRSPATPDSSTRAFIHTG